MLSDHAFQFFGRTITLTSYEQFLAILALMVVATAWIVQQFRRRRSVVVHRSGVSDQALYELSRIADAPERIANRPADEIIAAANRQAEPSTNPPSLSMFRR